MPFQLPTPERYDLKLPTGYLSFSQMQSWGGTDKSRESYRKAYYGGKRFTGNMYTEFGNKVTLAMENNEDWVSFLPRFSVFEQEFIVDVGGIPFKGSIDQFEPGPNAFVEQKTVMKKWSDNKIKTHKQFDYYSLAIEMMFGYVQDLAWFLDARTAINKKTVMFQGIELQGGSGELELTGEFNMIERYVDHADRQNAYNEIVRVGREIEEDYAAVGHLYKN